MRCERALCLLSHNPLFETASNPLTETSASFCSDDDTITITTTSAQVARALEDELVDAGASWEMSEFQYGDGCWYFEISRENLRCPESPIDSWEILPADKTRSRGEQN